MAKASPSLPTAVTADRTALKQAFLKHHKAPPDLERVFLAGDCSPRTYDRLKTASLWFAPCVVLMDAPPHETDIKPFLKVHALLAQGGLKVPEIYAHDSAKGFMLLEDWGDTTYRRALEKGYPKETLYETALASLLRVQQISAPASVPPYTVEVLVKELNSLLQWGPTRPLEPAALEDARSLWQAVLSPLVQINATQPALVLRDYHVDNLMLVTEKEQETCGLLDFQDALWGTVAYDLVSLLQDARYDVGERIEEHIKTRFRQQQPATFDQATFETAYTLLGLQRSAKILGIFLRKSRRDGRHEMLAHIPRVWRHIQRGLASPLGQPLVPWFNTLFPEGAPHA